MRGCVPLWSVDALRGGFGGDEDGNELGSWRLRMVRSVVSG